MAFFRTKSPEERAAALEEQMIRGRYIRARGELYDAVFDAGNNGGADPQWVESVMPSLAREAAEAWLDVYPDPTEADMTDLWEKDLRTFWHRSYWSDFDTATKDLAQEISVAVQREVVRQREARNGSGASAQDRADAVDALRGVISSWSAPEATNGSGSSDSEVGEKQDETPAAVGIARAIEVWRWANAEKLSDSARSRLDRVSRLVQDNAVGLEDVAAFEAREQVRFEQTLADMKHGQEMIQHVTRWVQDDPAKFEAALGLYLDGGGASDGLDIAMSDDADAS